MRLFEHFDRGAKINPNHPVYIFEGKEWSYKDAQIENLKFGNALAAAGIGSAHKCAVISDNFPPAFNCVIGLLRTGARWIPVNAKNAVQAHIDFLGLLECDVLIYTQVYDELVAEIIAAVPSIKTCICIDGDSPHGETLANFIKDASTDQIVGLPHDNTETTAIVGTGGTTGKSKGVEIPLRSWDCFIGSMLATLPFDKDTVYLAAAPMTHAAGAMAFPVLTQGGTILFHNGVNPALFISDIEKYKVTETFLPPTATLAILAQPNVHEADFSSLRAYLSAGAPMAPERAREAAKIFGPVWSQTYGQTEALMTITVLSPQDCFDKNGNMIEERFETVGRPSPFARVAIMDEEGNILPAGEKGEIVVQSDLVMNGYYRNPEATAEVSTFGWHHTGDVGAFDEDGFLRSLDRTKDMIISGGLNVFPSEIENCLMQHPAVHEAAVIGVPDEKWGEAVKACVQLREGGEAREEELIAYCKDKLGSVKAPKSIDYVTSFPKSPVGKLLKKELRAQYWEAAGRQI